MAVRLSDAPTLTLRDGSGGAARLSDAPTLVLRLSVSNARLSDAPVLVLRNGSDIPARLADAPVLILRVSQNSAWLSDAPVLVLRIYTRRRNIRWMRQGPHMLHALDRMFHQQFRLNMEVGVGNADAPNPIVTLQWSDDGGYTWSDGVPMPIGAAGEYDTLVQWFRLGMARDRVYRVWSDDPVLGQLIDAYAVVEEGIGGA